MSRSSKALLATLVLIFPCAALSSGFGWYVNTVPWADFKKDTDTLVEQAQEILAVSPQSEKLKQYLQNKLEEEIYHKHCHPKSGLGMDLSPRYVEFYSLRFVNYGESLQRSKGVKDSLFYRFAQRKPYVSIASKSNSNPYFFLTPEEVEAALRELRRINADHKHPAEFDHLAKHLEAVLLLAASDRYPDTRSSLAAGLKTGLMFCGHD